MTSILKVNEINTYDNTASISIKHNGTNALVINTSRNIGIGTNSPVEPLHVAGDARVDGITFRSGQYRYADYSTSHNSSTGTLVANMNTVYGNTYYLEITILGTENTLNRGMAKYLMIGTFHGANSNYYVTLSEIGRAGMNNSYGRPYLFLNGYESSFTTTDQTTSGTNVDRNELYCRTNAAYSGNMKIMIDRYQPAA